MSMDWTSTTWRTNWLCGKEPECGTPQRKSLFGPWFIAFQLSRIQLAPPYQKVRLRQHQKKNRHSKNIFRALPNFGWPGEEIRRSRFLRRRLQPAGAQESAKASVCLWQTWSCNPWRACHFQRHIFQNPRARRPSRLDRSTAKDCDQTKKIVIMQIKLPTFA